METVQRKQAYSVTEVAAMFGIDRTVVHRHLEKGRIEGVFRVGRELAIPDGARINLDDKAHRTGYNGVLDRYAEECDMRGERPTIPPHSWFDPKGE